MAGSIVFNITQSLLCIHEVLESILDPQADFPEDILGFPQ
jgi:hypothetical protein